MSMEYAKTHQIITCTIHSFSYIRTHYFFNHRANHCILFNFLMIKHFIIYSDKYQKRAHFQLNLTELYI